MIRGIFIFFNGGDKMITAIDNHTCCICDLCGGVGEVHEVADDCNIVPEIPDDWHETEIGDLCPQCYVDYTM